MVAETVWHYEKDDAPQGPISHGDLCALFANSQLLIDTRVWCDGMLDWVPASTIEDFRGIWGKGFGPRTTATPPLPPLPAPAAPSVRRPGRILEDHEMPDARRLNGEADTEPHPWVRFWARGLDNTLLLLVAVFAFSSLGPYDLMLYAVLFVGALFAYPFQLWVFGTTIGKAILGISVETPTGERPSYAQASARELGVYVKGYALGLPIVSFVMHLLAYKGLSNDGTSSWDKANGLVVRHKPAGGARWSAWLVVYGLLSFWTFVLAFPDRAAALGWIGRPQSSIASDGVTRTSPAPTTSPSTVTKPKQKPKLLTLPSGKPASQPAIKPKTPPTRPPRPQTRPAPSVIFKPEPAPEN
jgi:uncharacterized RDD family membrane protein YckC